MGQSSNSIRWREGQKEKLAAIAEHCGVEVVDLVRNAADAVIKYAEAHGGVVPFPLDFEIQYVPHRVEHLGKKRSLVLTERISRETRSRSARPQKVSR